MIMNLNENFPIISDVLTIFTTCSFIPLNEEVKGCQLRPALSYSPAYTHTFLLSFPPLSPFLTLA